MECTQRLECTQSNYETDFKNTCPEEIGFLGICGAKYPIKIGPNKIGRDPHTCNIVLSQNSISRQHAVINILNKTNFMLMDLDSANKTKLIDKTLLPYLPNPLRNGDTVQFGDVFGIFRVLEEDEDLPMTQAIEIPETPMHNHYISRINKAPITMVPESPDVSDRDDSFVAPSQTKERKESNGHFIKPSAKTTAIQPIGLNKIDNIYWNSSKKSLSISPNNSSTNLNISNNNMANDIHDLETQELCPKENPYADQIYAAETQMPEDMPGPSIYSQDTQGMPTINTNIPGVRKVSTQQEMQIDLFASNVGNGNETHKAKSKTCTVKSPKVTGTPQKEKDVDEVKNKTDLSDKMLFDEDYTQSIDGPKEIIKVTSKEIAFSKQGKTAAKREKRIKSSNSTDCEDIDIADNRNSLPAIVSRKVNIGDDDDTDCEELDISIANKVMHENQHKKDIMDMPTQLLEVDGAKNLEFLEDMPTQMLESDEAKKKELFEDMPTQIVEKDDAENMQTQVLDEEPNVKKLPVIAKHAIKFENLPTQVLFEEMPAKVTKKAIPTNDEDDILTQVIDEDVPTQVIEQEPITEQYSQEVVGPFKIPSRNVLKNKQVEVTSAPSLVPLSEIISENEKYYQSTQDVLDDLCSQREFSPEVIRTNKKLLNNKSNDVLKSRRSYDAKNDTSQIYKKDGPTSSSESEAKVNQYVNNLSEKEIRDVIGVNSVKKLKRMPSDSSDDNVTPRKTLKFTESDLPNSQEIKRLVPLNLKDDVDVILSDSDTENDSKQSTPEIFCKKINRKMNMQESLKQMLNADALPTRIMTRIRKPSDIVKTSEEKVKNAALHMLKPKIFTEQEAGVDVDIVKENISRLKKTKSNIKSYFKVSDKSDTRKTAKPNERLEISNNSKSETSIIQKSEVNTSNTSIQSNKVTNTTINQKTENTRSTRSRRNNIKEHDKNESTDNSKCQVEKKTRKKEKTSKSKEVEKSQAYLDSTANSNTSVRRTRRSTKEKVEKAISPKSSTSDVKTKPTNRRREKKAQEKDTAKADSVQETEVRRSKRQRVVKDTKENSQTEIKTKSILKKTKCDQSTVYNNSSGSSTDSPISIKRTFNASSEATTPMKTRSAFDPNCSSLRPTKTHYVLYTSFSSPETQTKLEKLGAVTVTDVTQCTVVMTCSVRRTFKLLCAVGLGRPVVGLAWLQACMDTKTIVDPWSYILKDEVAEKKYKFDLKKTLTGKRNYLNGYRVSSTPNVTPNAKEMKQIVECSGGWWGEGAGGAGGARWVCVTCVADKALWGALRRRGATLVTPEFILTGVMQQRADVATNSCV